MDIREAQTAVISLHQQVASIAGKDSEQDIRGMALPVMDAVVRAARQFVHLDDPILDSIEDVISPEAVQRGEPIRATDAQLVLWQLHLALDRAIKAEGGDAPLTLRPEPGPFDT
jgi:hypothetical protein